MSTPLPHIGAPAPWFIARSTCNERFSFNTIAGRNVVLCFFRSASDALSQEIIAGFLARKELFNDSDAAFFGVSVDADDERLARVKQEVPGFRYFWDFDYAISRLYHAAAENASLDAYRCFSVILDQMLRVCDVIPFGDNGAKHVRSVVKALNRLHAIVSEQSFDMVAPVLVVPRIFELGLCRVLMEYFEQQGGETSGFMRDVNGQTTLIVDDTFKRRKDREIVDNDLRNAVMFRIHDRLVPEIHKAFQFKVTRIERHLIACYDAASGGFFHPHRDNTTKGTAHRRFAVSLNLNTGEYSGGKLRFPEFGRHTYEAPAGGAVVFSCSLLHEATAVTHGRRFAYLPFLYDDDAARIREANRKFIRIGLD